jgi:hypothetical protein
VGFRNLVIDVISWQEFEFCSVAIVKNVDDRIVWRLITIYGSPYDDTKLDFLDEYVAGPHASGGGGDFTLVRCQADKSNGVVNFTHVNAFNDWIHRQCLIEIKDPAKNFTWNNHTTPILARLDKVFASVEW